MQKNSIIIVTGAAGFIGSCMVHYLNSKGYENLILVDEFSREDKKQNLEGAQSLFSIERKELFRWLITEEPEVEFVFHLGARTDTTEFDYSVHKTLNVDYSQKIWEYCVLKKIPLVYASSAATYGDGNMGYKDDHSLVGDLRPLNPYGISKNEFDKWALRQSGNKESQPPFWAGLKFFNVYGPNEYHKGRMASVIFHSHKQILESGFVKLFRSYKSNFKDGEQLRDFIYVKDLLKVCYWFLENYSKIESGLYNLGTGKARTFNDLVKATFNGMDKETSIQYIDMPSDLRESYQYFTEADMQKLRKAGYSEPFYQLEQAVDDYVRHYLTKSLYYQSNLDI